MLDFEAAKRVVRDRWLSAFADEPGGPQIIHDAECVEYEWGWLIKCGPSCPDEVPPEAERWGILTVLVDRITGHTMHVSTAGPRLAIMALLESRPQECRSTDVSTQEAGGLTRVSISMRAFSPLSELRAAETQPQDSVEVVRLTRRDD